MYRIVFKFMILVLFVAISSFYFTDFEIQAEEQKYMSPYPLPENNLVSNPSFEAGAGDSPRDWQKVVSDKSRLKWTEEAHWGKRSVVIQSSGERWERWQTKLKGVKPNTKYKVSVWAKARGEQLLTIEVFDQKIKTPLAASWMKFNRTVNSKDFSGECDLNVMTKGKRGNIWIDDISAVGPIKKGVSYPQIVAIPVKGVEKSEIIGDQTVLQDRAVNLIANGQCEIDSDGDGIPNGWHPAKDGEEYLTKTLLDAPYFDLDNEAGKYEYLSDYGFQSKHSLQMSVKGARKWGEWDVEVKGIKPNTKYNLSFWYYNPRGGALSFSCFGSLYKVNHFRGFRQWMYHTINLNSGSFSGDSTIGFILEGIKDRELMALVDNVQLYEGEVPRGAGKYVYTYNFFTGVNEAVLDFFTYDTVYVCPQIASSMGLGLRYKFYDAGKRPTNLRMHLDLPEGVTLAGWDTRHWSSWKGGCKLETSEATHNGRRYTRNTIIWKIQKGNYRDMDFTHPSHPGLKNVFWYLKTTLSPGEKRALYYSMDWRTNPVHKDGEIQYENTQSQEPRRLTVECINLPHAPHLDGFIHYEGITMDQVRYWPDFFKMLKFLDVNWLGINEHILNIYPADELRKMGFEPATWKNFFHANEAYNKPGGYKDEVLPIGIDGKPMTRGWQLPDLARRGEAYRQTVESYKKWIDRGIYKFVLDDEGRTECYCDECIKGFKGYLDAAGEKAGYEDPREFMKNPNPEIIMNQRWYEYGRWQYGKLIYDARKELEEYMREKGLDPEQLAFMNDGIPLAMDQREKDRKKLGMRAPDYLYTFYGQVFDYYGDQIYINCYDTSYRGLPNLGADRQEYNTREYGRFGLKQIPLPGAALTYMDPMNDYQPPKVLKYFLMELATSGIRGWWVYPFTYNLDLGAMLWMNQTRVEMKRAEEIFREGKPIRRFNELGIVAEEIKLKQLDIYSLEDKLNWQSLRGLKHRDEAIILVADYSTMENVPATIEFEYEVNQPSNIIDLQTGKKVGAITPQKPRYKVELGEERARWFYVGPKKRLE